ncbi:MAG: SpoIIE family protein phosphatase [Bacilli bacterium]|nr:SpoIIE family protein phosphatase [Bacilli bacterium]
MDIAVAVIRLILLGLLPPALAVVLYYLEKKAPFYQKIPFMWRRVIGGVAFGGLAVIATEFGVNIDGAVMNVRDAAAVTAGLLYGFPAGAIAGFIGGVERFASAYWNNTFYTQWACSISTFVSGLTAGLIRSYVFTSRRPRWAHGLLVGLLTETFHMLMIFLTNAGDPITAFAYVRILGNKMITANMTSAALAMGALQIMDYFMRDKTQAKVRKKPRIRSLMTLHFSMIGLITIAASGVLTYGLQSSMAYENSVSLLSLNVTDAKNDISDISDSNLLGLARNVAKTLEKAGMVPDNEDLITISEVAGVSEIHYVDANGIISSSSVAEDIGFDMKSGSSQSAVFCQLLENPGELVQAYMPTSKDPSVKKKYAAVSLSFGGFVQVAFNTTKFYESLYEIVAQVVQNRHIGESGYMLVADESLTIVSRWETLDGKTLESIGFPTDLSSKKEMERHSATIDEESSFYMFSNAEGYYVIGVVDTEEMLRPRDMGTFLGVYMEILIFSSLFIMVYSLIDRLVLRDLVKTNHKLTKIAGGDLEQRLDADSTHEFYTLSSSINSTVDTLKGYIALEASRYDEELALGKQIQLSSLPSKLAYLQRHEFDIYGTMTTAKQVGGDFYDYFMLPDKRIAMLIADVSGKGIPAALFMMKTKSVIKALAENGLSVEDIFQRANDRICEGNETDTFVTAWMGICDLSTGIVEFVNAGHNPPLAKINGKYQYLEMKRDLVLGAMEGVPYRKQTLKLSPRDVIFLYTDGITEAESGPENFYGEERLLSALNANVAVRDPERICHDVQESVQDFVGDHDQSDDMTMVCFSYYGAAKDYCFIFEPSAEAVGKLCDNVTAALEECGFNMVMINKVNLIVEEAAANIAFHAYEKKKGVGNLELSVSEAQIVLTFFDRGPKFDPLAKEDPDIHLAAEDRPIGGLGVFMIKKLSDKVYYSYQERQNILTVIINR